MQIVNKLNLIDNIFTRHYNRMRRVSMKYWSLFLTGNWLNNKAILPHDPGVTKDNTKQKIEYERENDRLFQQLRNSEQQYRNMLDKSPVGILLVEPNSGAIVDANKLMLGILGYSLDELRQLSANDLIPVHLREEREYHLKKLEKHDKVTFETNRLHKDSSLLPVEVTLSMNMYGDALPVIMTIVTDITERKIKERELNRKNRDLEQFAYLAAHDLKAPVANFYSLLSMLEAEEGIKEQSMELFDKTFAAVKQMQKTIKDLNEVIEVKNNLDLKFEKLKFQTVLAEVTTNLGDSIQKQGVRIEADFSQCETVLFPPIHLRSILQNLLTNSIKYCQEDQAPIISVSTRKENKTICLVVKDNGKGIDMNAYGHKLFGLFQRFHLEEEGKGIGLHLIKAIVENNGGHIDVKSEPNKGSEFMIYIKQ